MECRDYLAFSQKLTKMTCPVHPLFATTLSPPWRYAQASFCSVCRFLHIILFRQRILKGKFKRVLIADISFRTGWRGRKDMKDTHAKLA